MRDETIDLVFGRSENHSLVAKNLAIVVTKDDSLIKKLPDDLIQVIGLFTTSAWMQMNLKNSEKLGYYLLSSIDCATFRDQRE